MKHGAPLIVRGTVRLLTDCESHRAQKSTGAGRSKAGADGENKPAHRIAHGILLHGLAGSDAPACDLD